MTHRSPVIVGIVVLALSFCAVAQQMGMALGSISGSIRTGDNRPAADVRVDIRNLNTGNSQSTYTSQNGSFDVNSLPPGPYEVLAVSGIVDARERVDVHTAPVFLNLRLPRSEGADAGDRNVVSVAQFRVPSKARDRYRKADKALRENKLDQAEKFVNQALEIYPSYAEALTLRAVLRMDANRPEDAANDLDQAIKADPSYGMAYVVMGAVHNQASRFDAALRSLDRGVALVPTAWQGYFEMGKAFMGKGDYPAALRQIRKAEKFAPAEYALLHLVKAHALLGLKDYGTAMSELQLYLDREPEGQNSVAARQTLDKVKAFAATTR